MISKTYTIESGEELIIDLEDFEIKAGAKQIAIVSKEITND